jgi:hypothetical protein
MFSSVKHTSLLHQRINFTQKFNKNLVLGIACKELKLLIALGPIGML